MYGDPWREQRYTTIRDGGCRVGARRRAGRTAVIERIVPQTPRVKSFFLRAALWPCTLRASTSTSA